MLQGFVTTLVHSECFGGFLSLSLGLILGADLPLDAISELNSDSSISNMNKWLLEFAPVLFVTESVNRFEISYDLRVSTYLIFTLRPNHL